MATPSPDPRQLAKDILSGKISLEELMEIQRQRRAGTLPPPAKRQAGGGPATRGPAGVGEPIAKPRPLPPLPLPAQRQMPKPPEAAPVEPAKPLSAPLHQVGAASAAVSPSAKSQIGPLTPRELRRALILSEILAPPLALRQR